MFAKVIAHIALAAHGVGSVVWPAVDRAGRLHVTSGPSAAHEPLDLSAADVTFATGQEPRAFWCNGAGVVKVDGVKHDGTTIAGTLFTADGAGLLPVGRVSKVYKVGTTVPSLIALW